MTDEVVPAGQGVHCDFAVRPEELLYVPIGHFKQEEAAALGP